MSSPTIRSVTLALLLALLPAAGFAAPAQLKNWLSLGPVSVDVTKEYEHLQIYGLDRVGASLRPDREQDALSLAKAAAEEGAEARLFGQPARWQLLRLTYPERLASWARTGGNPILWSNALQTLISSEDRRVRLTLDGIGGVRVYLNGAPVYKYDWPGGRYDSRKRHNVDLDLQSGDNSLVVVLFAIHLHCTTAFYAETSQPVKTRVRWRDLGGARAKLEDDFTRLYVAPWMFRTDSEELTAGIDGKPSEFAFEFEVTNSAVPRARLAPGAASVGIARANQLPVPQFRVKTRARTAAGDQVEGPEFALQRPEATPQIGQDWDYERRRKYVIETAAAGPAGALKSLARAALGQKIAVADIQPALTQMERRLDTADFAFHDLVRLYYQFPNQLEPATSDAIRKAAVNFKYWMDEPGPSSMFMKSENHQILFHTLQFMTGILWPNETFVEIRAPGSVQALKGRILSLEWIDARQRYGFEEWLAPGYLDKDVQAMLDLVDLPNDDNRLALRASRLLDLLFLYLTTHEWNGSLHTTAGRVYLRQVVTPQTQAVASLLWLVTDKGSARTGSGALALALSRYKVPAEVLRFSQPGAPELTRTQQGRAARGFGVNTVTLRGEHAMLSTACDYRKGERGAQAQVVQATLPGAIPVFLNGANSVSDVSRPGYWMGNWELPRAFQVGEMAIAIYRHRDPLAFSHCFFPAPWMESLRERNGWIAGENAGGYVAVYSQSGTRLRTAGLYRGFEIVSQGPANIWLVKVGGKRKYPAFGDFLAALPKPEFQENGVTVGGIRASWDGPLVVDGKPQPASDFGLIENDWVKSEYGNELVTVRTPEGSTLRIGR